MTKKISNISDKQLNKLINYMIATFKLLVVEKLKIMNYNNISFIEQKQVKSVVTSSKIYVILCFLGK